MDSKTGPHSPNDFQAELLRYRPGQYLNELILGEENVTKRSTELFKKIILPVPILAIAKDYRARLGIPTASPNGDQIALYDNLANLVDTFQPGVVIAPDAKPGWDVRTKLNDQGLFFLAGAVRPELKPTSLSDLHHTLLKFLAFERLHTHLRNASSELALDLEQHTKEYYADRESILSCYGKDWLQLLALQQMAQTTPEQAAVPLVHDWMKFYAVTSFKRPVPQNYRNGAAYVIWQTEEADPFFSLKFFNPETSDADMTDVQKRRQDVEKVVDTLRTNGRTALYAENSQAIGRFVILGHLQQAQDYADLQLRLSQVVIMSILGLAPEDSAFTLVQGVPLETLQEWIRIAVPELFSSAGTDRLAQAE